MKKWENFPFSVYFYVRSDLGSVLTARFEMGWTERLRRFFVGSGLLRDRLNQAGFQVVLVDWVQIHLFFDGLTLKRTNSWSTPHICTL